MTIRFWMAWKYCLLGLFLLVSNSASGSDLSTFLRSAFSQQVGRPPTGPELYYHANVNRAQGPLENYIQMCGSDDYFINQAQRNMEVYVTRLYQTFLRRSPRPDELRFWVNQFQNASGVRVAMVRQFCQANHVTQMPGIPSQMPVFQVPTAAPDIAYQLVTKINLFNSLVQKELGRSAYGRRVVTQASQLLSVAEQYRQLLLSPNRTSGQVQIAADNVEKSLQKLEQEYRRVAGASPQCQIVLRQISQLVTAVRGSTMASQPAFPRQPAFPQQPAVGRPNFPPGNFTPGYAPAPGGGIGGLLNSIQQFSYGLQSYKNQSPFYGSLYRDVQGLSVQIEALALLNRQGQRGSRMRQAVSNVQNQAGSITRKISQADMQVQRGWWNIQYQLRQIGSSPGVRSGSWGDANQPVVLNRPAWNQFPYQRETRQPSNRNQDTVMIADQLLAKIDGYIGSLRPLIRKNRNAAILYGSVQNLRHSVLSFRTTAAAGKHGSSLRRAADKLMSRYERTSKQAAQLIASDSTLNSPLFYQIGELVQKLRYAVRGISA